MNQYLITLSKVSSFCKCPSTRIARHQEQPHNADCANSTRVADVNPHEKLQNYINIAFTAQQIGINPWSCIDARYPEISMTLFAGSTIVMRLASTG